jgi:hypothetical protein
VCFSFRDGLDCGGVCEILAILITINKYVLIFYILADFALVGSTPIVHLILDKVGGGIRDTKLFGPMFDPVSGR